MPRLFEPRKLPLESASYKSEITGENSTEYYFLDPDTKQRLNVLEGRCSSWHSYWNLPGYADRARCTSPITGGPMECRPPAFTAADSAKFGSTHAAGDYFAHQRWNDPGRGPKYGYMLSLGQVSANTSMYNGKLPPQEANSVWSFGDRLEGARDSNWLNTRASKGTDPNKPSGYYGYRTGNGTAPLIKVRYNEPVLTRIHNDLPVDRELNNGFGRNEISTHYHNAHNGAESDGACNAYHFAGTFYDYHWSSMLARHDAESLYMNKMDKPINGVGGFKPNDKRASSPNGSKGREQVQGDFREIQGTMWFHDHRFFFTAENVHKGNFGMINMYSALDRGNEDIDDGVNLMLPSGKGDDYGNTQYDVNLAISNPALDKKSQLYFDIFDTDGFLGDILATNGVYYPYMQVESRRYRFRILNASMSRFLRLALIDDKGAPVPFWFIANDGNFVPKPIYVADGRLDEQGVGERYDIVVDFSQFDVSKRRKLYLVNILQQTNGRKPDGSVTISDAMRGVSGDPAVGPVLRFDVDFTPKYPDKTPVWDRTRLPSLTEQIPVLVPDRTRTVEYVRGDGDSRKTASGQCIPECGNVDQFPWGVKVNGQAMHSLNASRIAALVRDPGDVEHWSLVNGGGGWDHPIHMHFEESITLDRGSAPIPDTEKLVRKDVWRLRPGGTVKFQIRFGEFGGSYVNHCHNTVHEDFAMLLRWQLLRTKTPDGTAVPQGALTPTPLPDATNYTVKWIKSELLPEADPNFNLGGSSGSGSSGSGSGGSGSGSAKTTASTSGGKGKG